MVKRGCLPPGLLPALPEEGSDATGSWERRKGSHGPPLWRTSSLVSRATGAERRMWGHRQGGILGPDYDKSFLVQSPSGPERARRVESVLGWGRCVGSPESLDVQRTPAGTVHTHQG